MTFQKLKYVFFLFIFLINCSYHDETKNHDAKIITSEFKSKLIGRNVLILEDPDKKLTIDDVIKKRDDEFKVSEEEVPAFGITSSGYWIKTKIQNDLPNRHWIFEFELSNIDYVDMYVVKKGSPVIHLKSGQAISPRQQEIQSSSPTFLVKISKNESADLYFYIQDPGLSSFPMKLWDEKDFSLEQITDQFYMGMYFGFLIIMTFYNLLIFLRTKEQSFLCYSVYLTGTVGAYAVYRGYGDLYLWPNAGIWWKNYSVFVFSTVIAIGLLLFMKNFLNIHKKDRMFYIPYKFLLVIQLLAVFLYAFLPMQIYIYPWMLLSTADTILAMWAGIAFYMRGYRPARFYLLAWMMVLPGIFLIILKFAGIVPTSFLTEYGMQIGGSLEVALFALALADRFMQFRDEKMAIEKHAIQTQARLDSLRLQKVNMEKDLEKARRIQKGLIPKLNSHKNVAHLYLPMESVGGDYFDIINLKGEESKIGFFISDVSGHGVEAALITVMINRFISSIKDSKESTDILCNPGEFMTQLNDNLLPILNGNFVSAFYGVIDRNSGKFLFSSASHPAPLLFNKKENNKGEVFFLDTSPQGPPMGIFESREKNKMYENKEILLPEKSKLLFFSDGLTEAIEYDYEEMERGLDSFSKTCLYETFKNSFHWNVEQMVHKMYVDIIEHTHGKVPDDICAVAIEV